MAEKTYGFGIVGLGMIAEFHANAIADLPNGRVAACMSRDQAKADVFADKHGGRAYTDLDKLLEDPDVDIVAICTPSGVHLETTVKAARHGKHVVCEKPLEISLDRIDQMIAAHEEAGTVLAGIFQSRTNPTSQLMKDTVASGRFGKLAFASVFCPWWREQKYYDQGVWKGTRALDGGGALMNQSIHAIDLLQWVVGPVKAVTAQVATLAHPQIEVEDTAGAVVEFENGALGLIQGATSMWPGLNRRLEIAGDSGTAIMVEDTISTWRFKDEKPQDAEILKKFGGQASTAGASDPAAISHAGHTRCFASAIEAIESGKTPAISGPEARKAVEIILAIYQSSHEGRRVELPL